MEATSITIPQQKSRFRRFVIRFLGVLLVIYVGLCTFIYVWQDQLTFIIPKEYAKVTPLDRGIPFEDLHIPVKGPEQIHAWWVPASPSSDKVLLDFHGDEYVLEDNIAGKLQPKLELIPLHRVGVNLLAIDYRGFGSSSPGIPNEKRVYEDARAAFNYLTVQRGVPSGHIIFVGYSLGTGPATQMAIEHPEAGGLVLISAFTNTSDIASSVYWYLRFFPHSLLSHNPFDNFSKINSVHIPIFIAVGTLDDLTIPAMAQALFQRANEPKRLYLSPGADHDGIWQIGGQALQDQISAFIQTIH